MPIGGHNLKSGSAGAGDNRQGKNKSLKNHALFFGQMAEWMKATAWKAVTL